MGDFDFDTSFTPIGDGSFTRTVSRDWEIWGPNGGYMAALALRAAGKHCGRARPANATVHFLGVANFDDPLVIMPTTLRQARSATSVAVHISQNHKPIVHAMVWGIDDDITGLEHNEATMPDVPSWATLPTSQERFAAAGVEPPNRFAFWNNFEQRPTSWIDDWDNRELTAPNYLAWIKYLGATDRNDRWLHAARLLLLVDLGGWPAVGMRHNDQRFIGPSIDVSCEFHHLDSSDDWHLLHGTSAHGSGGLIGTAQQVWNDSGQLTASGISHLLCEQVV